MAVRESLVGAEQILRGDQGFVLQQAAEGFKVRLRVLEPSRQPSRRRMAGGELRLRTVSMYMGALYDNTQPNTNANTYLHGNIVMLARLAYLPQNQCLAPELRLICQRNFGLTHPCP